MARGLFPKLLEKALRENLSWGFSTIRLSYREYIEYPNLASGMWDCNSFQKVNNRGVDQTGLMHRLIGLDKQKIERKIVNISLPINFNICFRCSKEPSQ